MEKKNKPFSASRFFASSIFANSFCFASHFAFRSFSSSYFTPKWTMIKVEAQDKTFAGTKLFLSLNQQCQSTEENTKQTSGQASSFRHQPQDAWLNGCWSLDAGTLMPVPLNNTEL